MEHGTGILGRSKQLEFAVYSTGEERAAQRKNSIDLHGNPQVFNEVLSNKEK